LTNYWNVSELITKALSLLSREEACKFFVECLGTWI